jgi:hypothetical protein
LSALNSGWEANHTSLFQCWWGVSFAKQPYIGTCTVGMTSAGIRTVILRASCAVMMWRVLFFLAFCLAQGKMFLPSQL